MGNHDRLDARTLVDGRGADLHRHQICSRQWFNMCGGMCQERICLDFLTFIFLPPHKKWRQLSTPQYAEIDQIVRDRAATTVPIESIEIGGGGDGNNNNMNSDDNCCIDDKI